MDIVTIVGYNAIFAGLAGVVIGLVSQIIKNYRRKSCEGLSLGWICLAGYAYVSWLVYGVVTQDYFLCVPQSLGTLCMIIILWQFWIYRKKNKAMP